MIWDPTELGAPGVLGIYLFALGEAGENAIFDLSGRCVAISQEQEGGLVCSNGLWTMKHFQILWVHHSFSLAERESLMSRIRNEKTLFPALDANQLPHDQASKP